MVRKLRSQMAADTQHRGIRQTVNIAAAFRRSYQACTQDCSGHEAGYQWAENHDITDPDDCGGDSESFIEGCQSYANEHSSGASQDPGDQ